MHHDWVLFMSYNASIFRARIHYPLKRGSTIPAAARTLAAIMHQANTTTMTDVVDAVQLDSGHYEAGSGRPALFSLEWPTTSASSTEPEVETRYKELRGSSRGNA